MGRGEASAEGGALESSDAVVAQSQASHEGEAAGGEGGEAECLDPHVTQAIGCEADALQAEVGRLGTEDGGGWMDWEGMGVEPRSSAADWSGGGGGACALCGRLRRFRRSLRAIARAARPAALEWWPQWRRRARPQRRAAARGADGIMRPPPRPSAYRRGVVLISSSPHFLPSSKPSALPSHRHLLPRRSTGSRSDRGVPPPKVHALARPRHHPSPFHISSSPTSIPSSPTLTATSADPSTSGAALTSPRVRYGSIAAKTRGRN